jgi:hypothetical protein
LNNSSGQYIEIEKMEEQQKKVLYIVKTDFVGTDGNSTTEYDRSTTKEWAERKYTRSLERWAKILKPDYVNLLQGLVVNDENRESYNMYLQSVINLSLKNCKFKIELYVEEQ